MHIGKTGGTAIKRTLHGAGYAYWREDGHLRVAHTPLGAIRLHPHRFKLTDLPDGDRVFFCVRDPVSRFVSAFYSRRARGGEGYKERWPWSEAEERAFGTFETPEQLAVALGSKNRKEREFARWAMGSIRHLGFQRRYTGPDRELRARAERIVYVARQETLDADWERLKVLLELPPDLELIKDAAKAHRRPKAGRVELDPAAVRNLHKWYARDYELLDLIDEMRAERGWAPDGGTDGASRGPRRRGLRARRLVRSVPRGRTS